MLPLLKSLAFNIKRPSLGWLSRREVRYVRDRIIQLYLAPGESIRVAPPSHIFGVRYVDISFSGGAKFDFEYAAIPGVRLKIEAWLKFRADETPYWQYRVGPEEAVMEQRYKGDDEFLHVPAFLIKAYAFHFPFLSTDNFVKDVA